MWILEGKGEQETRSDLNPIVRYIVLQNLKKKSKKKRDLPYLQCSCVLELTRALHVFKNSHVSTLYPIQCTRILDVWKPHPTE